jgi:hypothetical protein
MQQAVLEEVMSSVAVAQRRAAISENTVGNSGFRRMLRTAFAALRALLPPSSEEEHSELPAEWFKYPPL